ncbi:MAG: DUF349 domain-containing protein [Candidatus Omnitrophica bacterium]|nr:DUF349 domain-containing protein [Candidatus Omnitrophota bacterium]
MSHLEQWGYIDEQGNVCQRDCQYFKGRIIGRADGRSEDEIWAYYALRFEKLNQYYDELELEYNKNRGRRDLIDKIHRLLDYITDVDALGDFDSLLKKVHLIRDEIEGEFGDNLKRKEEICQRVEELVNPVDWKSAGEEVKEIQDEFRARGSVSDDKEDYIWRRFREALDKFYEGRRNYFEQRDKDRLENLEKKEALCRKAEDLCLTTDWNNSSDELKHMQQDWKEVGPVPRDRTEELGQRFKQACDVFFKRRAQHYNLLDEERLNNLKRKELMCEEAEALSESDDWKKTAALLKKLQEDWKEIGQVPKEKSDEIWLRFKTANDNFFQRQHEFVKQKKQQQKLNLREKQLLCEEVEQLVVLKDFHSVKDQVKEIQQRWKSIGPVPGKEEADELWRRFKTACDNIFQ